MSSENVLQVGHARADITPPLGIPMGGYAGRGDRGCEEIEEPLVADALYIRQGETATVLIAADVVNIDESWGGKVRRAVGDKLGLPARNVVLLASHTHFGPQTGTGAGGGLVTTKPEHQAWIDDTVAAMTKAAVEAAGDLRTTLLKTAVRDVAPVMYNRRLRRPDGTCCSVLRLPLPEDDLTFGPVDPNLRLLRFDDEEGRPIVQLVSVGIHPVIGGGNFYGISPDYVGVLRRVLENTFGVPAIFVLGTAGNVVPIKRGEGQRERIGRYLAGAALEASGLTEALPPLDVRLRVKGERREIPSLVRGSQEEMERRVDEAKVAVERAEKSGKQRELQRAGEHLRRTEGAAKAAERFGEGDTLPFDLTAIALGDLGIICLPGEIFVETGLHLQARSPFPATLVLSCTNQSTGYLVPRTAYWAGGYEASVTRMSEEAEGRVAEAANALLIDVWEEGRQP